MITIDFFCNVNWAFAHRLQWLGLTHRLPQSNSVTSAAQSPTAVTKAGILCQRDRHPQKRIHPEMLCHRVSKLHWHWWRMVLLLQLSMSSLPVNCKLSICTSNLSGNCYLAVRVLQARRTREKSMVKQPTSNLLCRIPTHRVPSYDRYCFHNTRGGWRTKFRATWRQSCHYRNTSFPGVPVLTLHSFSLTLYNDHETSELLNPNTWHCGSPPTIVSYASMSLILFWVRSPLWSRL